MRDVGEGVGQGKGTWSRQRAISSRMISVQAFRWAGRERVMMATFPSRWLVVSNVTEVSVLVLKARLCEPLLNEFIVD